MKNLVKKIENRVENPEQGRFDKRWTHNTSTLRGLNHQLVIISKLPVAYLQRPWKKKHTCCERSMIGLCQTEEGNEKWHTKKYSLFFKTLPEVYRTGVLADDISLAQRYIVGFQ